MPGPGGKGQPPVPLPNGPDASALSARALPIGLWHYTHQQQVSGWHPPPAPNGRTLGASQNRPAVTPSVRPHISPNCVAGKPSLSKNTNDLAMTSGSGSSEWSRQLDQSFSQHHYRSVGSASGLRI